MTAGNLGMSKLTQSILGKVEPRMHGRIRRQNFQILQHLLPDLMLIRDEEREFAPFGFPIVLENAEQVARELAARRIYIPRYWPDAPASEREFPYEHRLAGTVLVLPVDYRYGESEMIEMAQAVREVM